MNGKLVQKTQKATDIPDCYMDQCPQDFLEHMDGRVALVKQLRRKLDDLYDDLGGEAQVSQKEKILCKRLVHLERWIERQEAVLMEGGTVHENTYLNAVNVLSSLCGRLGLKRRTKVVGTLAELLSQSREKVDE
jgi:hypothetical protein